MTSPSDEVFNGAAAWAEVAELNQRLYDAREALERIAKISDGQEGRTAQTMMMHGFSPVKALQEIRDIARQALTPEKRETP